MGYTQTGSFEDFGREDGFLEAARRTVERVGPLLQERVKHHTPVAKPPNEAIAGEWLAARKRIPGALKESWHVGHVEVEMGGNRFAVDVYSDDPIAPHVEYPTAPHMIHVKDPRGWLRFWDRAGRTIFAKLVHHPGTQGTYMLATALVEVAEQWEEIGREEMARWAREQMAHVG